MLDVEISNWWLTGSPFSNEELETKAENQHYRSCWVVSHKISLKKINQLFPCDVFRAEQTHLSSVKNCNHQRVSI